MNELTHIDNLGNARFVSYGTKDGLPTDVLFSLAEDKDGNIWMGSESGLSRMNKAKRHFDNFLKQEIGEELLFEESTAIASTDGRLLFGTNRGLLSFVPGHIRKMLIFLRLFFWFEDRQSSDCSKARFCFAGVVKQLVASYALS